MAVVSGKSDPPPPITLGELMPVYNSDSPEVQATIDQMFEAAANGDITLVTLLAAKLQLGWDKHDIERFTQAASLYSPIEQAGESLNSRLQSFEGDKVFNLSPNEEAYIKEAIAQAEAGHGNKMTDAEKKAYEKLRNGEKLSKEEAQELYKWFVAQKEFVIPTAYRMETLKEMIKRAKDNYQKTIQDGVQAVQKLWTF